VAQSDEQLTTERRGEALLIRFNRPAARNAINLAQAHRLSAAMDLLDDDDALRVGIISGDGKAFSAGTDLKGVARGEPPIVAPRGYYGMLAKPSAKPLIAAVEGFALGGGLELALACDLVVAAESATFGLPEVARGVLATGGAMFRLPRRIPYHRAMELALTGRVADVHEMERLGLVNQVTPVGDAVEAAITLATSICRNAPLSVVQTKAGIKASYERMEEEGWSAQDGLFAPLAESADFQEGLSAFQEKREPRWRGK
jgi:enoyl-CoA hydratase